ncbi:MAG: hypothetical protein IT371_16445 [Deltaproteobacteria bacterium]|nr:hypothetical protein [Deltaproteobacteria bacterium]
MFQSNYDLDGTPVELVRYTCEFPNGPADQYLATQFMEISHAGASEYLPPSGDVRWQYLTRMWSTWGVPGDTGHSESWSCFGIYWTT